MICYLFGVIITEKNDNIVAYLSRFIQTTYHHICHIFFITSLTLLGFRVRVVAPMNDLFRKYLFLKKYFFYVYCWQLQLVIVWEFFYINFENVFISGANYLWSNYFDLWVGGFDFCDLFDWKEIFFYEYLFICINCFHCLHKKSADWFTKSKKKIKYSKFA